VNGELSIEQELNENEYSLALSYRCVLEKKGAYLPAKRTPDTTDPERWDLAATGIHRQQSSTELVKRMKHMIIQFDTQDRECLCVMQLS
jgi:hypothetical protein